MLDRSVRARLEPDGHQVVEVTVDGGFRPGTIVAQAGRPLRLVFRRDDDDECSERVIFSAPRLDRRLTQGGTTIIELPAQQPGDVRFTCAMGRYRGRIELVEAPRSMFTRLLERASRIESPLGTALVLWICSLPLIALAGVFLIGVTSALLLAAAALLAWVVGCLWAFDRTARPA